MGGIAQGTGGRMTLDEALGKARWWVAKALLYLGFV